MTCFKEIKLPDSERAGPQVLDDTAPDSHAGQLQSTVSMIAADEGGRGSGLFGAALGHNKTVTMTEVNHTLPPRLGYRSNQPAVCKLFHFVQRLHVCVREGEPNTQARLCLRLSVSFMSPTVRRQRLGLSLLNVSFGGSSAADARPDQRHPRPPSPCAACSHSLPRMSGAGKRKLRELKRPSAAPASAKAR